MSGLISPLPAQPTTEPARCGDSLDARPAPDIRELLGPDISHKVHAACRHMEVQMMSRKERYLAHFFRDIATIFKVEK